MKLQKLASLTTAVAFLAALAAEPAFAADPNQSVTQLGTVNSTTSGTNTSTVDGTSYSGISGNAAHNNSAGNGTQQSNDLYLQTSNGTSQTSAQSSSQTFGSGSSVTQTSLTNTSTIGGSAGSGNTGNTAISSAAGDGHEQANLLNLSRLGSGGSNSNVSATQTLGQTFSGSSYKAAPNGNGNGSQNTSTLGNNGSGVGPGENDNGIVTLNSTSGAANAQVNATTLVRSYGGITGTADQEITQSTTINVVQQSGNSDTANITRAGSFATGIAALNNSSGIQNAQINGVMLTDNSGGSGTGSSTGTQNVTQSITNSAGTGVQMGGSETANLGSAGNANGSPVYQTSGLAAVNNAAGNSNQQANAMFMSAETGAATENQNQAKGTGQQYSGGSVYQMTTSATNKSHISGNTGANSTGAVTLNNAAGAGNAQYNEMLMNSGSSQSWTAQTLSQNISSGNYYASGDSNTGDINDQVGQGVTGYVAANSAAGAGNQQGNQLILLTNTSGITSPTVSTTQSSTVTAQGPSETNSAGINGAFQNAKGAVAANAVAGGFNQQGNVILVTSGTLAGTAPTSSQSVSVTMNNGNGPISMNNTATVGSGAFSGSSGAVAGNVAAGVGNTQTNIITLGNH